jgi:hypothetical protein
MAFEQREALLLKFHTLGEWLAGEAGLSPENSWLAAL